MPDADIPAEELKALVQAFKAIVKKQTGKDFPTDPREQLWQAIEAVFRSWNNHRAIVYRRMHDIPDDWGTACNVQAMVFGNLGDTSATGVAFTRDPSTGEKRALRRVAARTRRARTSSRASARRCPSARAVARAGPTSRSRRRCRRRTGSSIASRRRSSATSATCRTSSSPSRPASSTCSSAAAAKRTARAAVRVAVDMVKEGLHLQAGGGAARRPGGLDQLLHPTLDPKAPKKLLARGLSASPGAASGHIVFNADEAERRAGQGKPVILVRVETSPEDIHGMKAARGILTARGGMTSHAAVVARGMGKPCVAGVSAVAVNYEAQTMTITVYDDGGRPTETVTLKKGDVITIDGGTGHVYDGAVPDRERGALAASSASSCRGPTRRAR